MFIEYFNTVIIFQGSHGSRPSSPNNELRLVHKEELSPNAKVAILEDIDNDGVEELIIGYTDRYVRIYKWSIQGLNHFDFHYESVFFNSFLLNFQFIKC